MGGWKKGDLEVINDNGDLMIIIMDLIIIIIIHLMIIIIDHVIMKSNDFYSLLVNNHKLIEKCFRK